MAMPMDDDFAAIGAFAEGDVAGTGGKRKGCAADGSQADAKKKARGQRQPSDKCCFVGQCSNKVKANSKWCIPHTRDANAMIDQAKKAGKLSELQQVLGDPHKASLALSDFAAENCDGAFRKKLIDWVSFTRRHGVRLHSAHLSRERNLDVGRRFPGIQKDAQRPTRD